MAQKLFAGTFSYTLTSLVKKIFSSIASNIEVLIVNHLKVSDAII